MSVSEYLRRPVGGQILIEGLRAVRDLQASDQDQRITDRGVQFRFYFESDPHARAALGVRVHRLDGGVHDVVQPIHVHGEARRHAGAEPGVVSLQEHLEVEDLDASRVLQGVEYGSDEYDTAAGCDVLVLATEWNQFRNLDLPRIRAIMNNPTMVDLRNVYEPEDLLRQGFRYAGVGR